MKWILILQVFQDIKSMVQKELEHYMCERNHEFDSHHKYQEVGKKEAFGLEL